MTVQYIVSTLSATGPTQQLLNIVTNLDKGRWSPHIVTLSPEPSNSYLKQFSNDNITVTSLDLSRFWGFVLGPSRLQSVTQKIDPAIIHTQGIRADSLAARYLDEYPHITTLRNFPPEDYIPRYGKVLGHLMVWQQFRAARLADQAIACSRTIQDKYSKRGIATDAISNGVDASAYQPPTPEDRRKIRNELNIKPDQTVVISVGGLIERKDPVTVIDGFKHSEVSANGRLLLLGDGPLIDQCRSVATEPVEIVGHVTDVERYLKAADVFVSASHSEGLPNAVMEALATGNAVVLSDIGPHREILNVDSTAGDLFETSNVTSLSQTLDDVADTTDRRRGAARKIIETEFNAKTMAKRYQSMYEKIVQ
jgi:glycosyltransferase involved in cell wall biosynthesis